MREYEGGIDIMQDWQKEVLERLYNLAKKYYTEETKGEKEGEIALKIPDNQPERRFIQEVFKTCGYILDDFEAKAEQNSGINTIDSINEIVKQTQKLENRFKGAGYGVRLSEY